VVDGATGKAVFEAELVLFLFVAWRKISSKSLRSKACGSARRRGSRLCPETGCGTITDVVHDGQRTVVPAFRRAMPISWLQFVQRKRIGIGRLSAIGHRLSDDEN
jgi:hypothetical protein